MTMLGFNLLTTGIRLPTLGLVGKCMVPDLVDSVGGSSITLTTGTTDFFMGALFSFPSTDVMLQADLDEGGNIFFDSLNTMAPIARYGYEWYALLNTSFVWIGLNGVAIYSIDTGSKASIIQRYLKPMDFAVFGGIDTTFNGDTAVIWRG